MRFCRADLWMIVPSLTQRQRMQRRIIQIINLAFDRQCIETNFVAAVLWGHVALPRAAPRISRDRSLIFRSLASRSLISLPPRRAALQGRF